MTNVNVLGLKSGLQSSQNTKAAVSKMALEQGHLHGDVLEDFIHTFHDLLQRVNYIYLIFCIISFIFMSYL